MFSSCSLISLAALPASSLQGTSVETSSSGEIFSISATFKFREKKSYLAVKVYSYDQVSSNFGFGCQT